MNAFELKSGDQPDSQRLYHLPDRKQLLFVKYFTVYQPLACVLGRKVARELFRKQNTSVR